MSLPSFLDPEVGTSRHVGQKPDTGRWFIKLGTPGFNCRANNCTGFASEAAALDMIESIVAARAKSFAKVAA
jgi:hypothetical protein